MKSIFGIHTSQKDLAEKYCFNKCNKILFSGLTDNDLGYLYPCDEEKCLYEEKRLKYGKVKNQVFYLRKLKKEE